LIVLGLGVSRKETKRIHNFLNNQKNFNFDFESDLHKISLDNSENIVINRIKELENRLYNNTSKLNKNFHVTGDIAFYFLPYTELLINNFPYIKFISTKKSKKNIFNDIMSDIETKNSIFSRLFMFKKRYKNHWIEHNGDKWEKDYLLDKCYPKFNNNNLENSIYNYIDLYIENLKKIQKKYPKNLKVFYSDELESEYGKKKVLSYIGVN
jgi:hypothetical protein